MINVFKLFYKIYINELISRIKNIKIFLNSLEFLILYSNVFYFLMDI